MSGLERRYDVRRVDGRDGPGDKHDGCRYFVLDLTHDSHAPAAMRAYAEAADLPQLLAEIDATNVPAPGDGTVTIGADELHDLRQEARKLRALEAAGVDNWSGYSYAMQLMREDDES